MILLSFHFSFFFFNDTATTEIYTLSLHDALPLISASKPKAGLPSLRNAKSGRARKRSTNRLISFSDISLGEIAKLPWLFSTNMSLAFRTFLRKRTLHLSHTRDI